MTEFFPNSDKPVPLLVTESEAVVILRLDEDARSPQAALRALRRLVETKRLRPVRVGRHNRFAREELRRFILGATELLSLAPISQANPWN